MHGHRNWKTLLLAAAFAAMGQASPGPTQTREAVSPAAPAFEVASVRINKVGVPRPQAPLSGGEVPPPPPPPFSIRNSPGTLTIVNATLMECLTWAYGFRRWQIAGPDWITADRYDITAKASASVEEGPMKRMLQSLLADRFRMTLRQEKRDATVMALLVAKDGPKFQASAPDARSGMDVRFIPASGGIRWSFQNMPLDRIEGILSGLYWDPVLNMTGLRGGFDFTFERPMRDDETGAPSGFGDVHAALQKQLGLRLERRKLPIEFLVIERAEKIPTEN